jgi:hypothetical protein
VLFLTAHDDEFAPLQLLAKRLRKVMSRSTRPLPLRHGHVFAIVPLPASKPYSTEMQRAIAGNGDAVKRV